MSLTRPTPEMNIGHNGDQLINTYPAYLKKRFGGRVQKITVDAGFSCPNRDGRKGSGGCIYCNNEVFSPSLRSRPLKRSIREQLNDIIPKYKTRYKTSRFIAYFQPFTNTDASVARLESIYQEALSHPEVIGLAVGTRPDCIDEDILTLLDSLSKNSYITIEYGCESVYDKTLRWINRGHTYQTLVDAVKNTSGYNIEICLHVILGFPTETRNEILAMADRLSELPIRRIKLHHLHIVKNTALADMFLKNPFQVYTLREFVILASDFLERLSPDIIVERLSGESPPELTIAPDWHIRGSEMFRLVSSELKQRNTFQGSKKINLRLMG